MFDKNPGQLSSYLNSYSRYVNLLNVFSHTSMWRADRQRNTPLERQIKFEIIRAMYKYNRMKSIREPRKIGGGEEILIFENCIVIKLYCCIIVKLSMSRTRNACRESWRRWRRISAKRNERMGEEGERQYTHRRRKKKCLAVNFY